MAKRKRLTPSVIPSPGAVTEPPETKGLKNGWAGTQIRSGSHAPSPAAPIADVAGSAATAAALDELAHELQSARANGRMVVKAALAAVDESYLVRDRTALDEAEMESLKTSLRERGQQTPIEVVDLGEGRLGLISGWRRLTALKALHAEAPKGGFGHVQCLIKAPETSSDAYVAMVEENEIRTGLSFYERARIAARASEQGVFASPRVAAKTLFHAVPRSKRSKIYSFLDIYTALDDVLRFPQALSEKMGLQLAKLLSSDDQSLTRLKSALSAAEIDTAQDELAVLSNVIAGKQSEALPKAKDIQPGVTMTTQRHKIVLSGSGVTAELQEKLRVWLGQGQ